MGSTRINTNHMLLYPEISYLLQGCFFEIRNEYGSGHKEKIYQNLLIDYLQHKGLAIVKEKSIQIYSDKSGKLMGTYRPDLVIDNKIIVEIKATMENVGQYEKQLYYYLKNSEYELGYLVNFGTPKLFVKRIIYTNNKKTKLRVGRNDTTQATNDSC